MVAESGLHVVVESVRVCRVQYSMPASSKTFSCGPPGAHNPCQRARACHWFVATQSIEDASGSVGGRGPQREHRVGYRRCVGSPMGVRGPHWMRNGVWRCDGCRGG